MNSMDPTNIVCNVIEGLSVISNPCSAVVPGAFIKAYFPQNASICNYASTLQSYGVAYNLKCCSQDNCNGPYFTSATAATPLSTLAIASVTSVNASVEAFVATSAPWSTPPSSSQLLCYVGVGGAAQGSAAHYKCPWVNSALRPPSIRCQALSQIHDNTVDTNIHCSRRGMNLKTAKQAHEKSSDLTHDRCFLGSYDRCASANLTCVDCTAPVPIPKHA